LIKVGFNSRTPANALLTSPNASEGHLSEYATNQASGITSELLERVAQASILSFFSTQK
jgi:hypothetical protein